MYMILQASGTKFILLLHNREQIYRQVDCKIIHTQCRVLWLLLCVVLAPVTKLTQ